MRRISRQAFERLDRGELIDFTWQGKALQGVGGDTLASALLANGIRLVGRGFKYGRPRGLIAAGVEEPNATLALDYSHQGHATPNPKATEIELYQQLEATSASGIPRLESDLRQWMKPLHRFMGAGFYYKTFKWPQALWPRYEQLLRRFTGLAAAPEHADAEHYDHLYHHPDIAVVGGGFAGIAATLKVAQSGANVLLIDERPRLGGEGYSEMARDSQAARWGKRAIKQIDTHPRITLLKRACAFQLEDGNLLYAQEARQDHLSPDQRNPKHCRQRLHRIRFRQLILATGAHERPMLFANNDLPGIMLGGAVARYLHEFALLCGSRIVLAGNNHSLYPLARDLLQHLGKGVESVHLVDQRLGLEPALVKSVTDLGGHVLEGMVPLEARGTQAIKALRLGATNQSDNKSTELPCDLLALCGGFNPVVHLDCHTGDKPVYDEEIRAFVPTTSAANRHAAGSLLGYAHWQGCVTSGEHAAVDALYTLGLASAPGKPPKRDSLQTADFHIPDHHPEKVFIDLQNDVTQKDIGIALKENFTSIEHIKRYTALGFGADQGKTGNVLGIAVAAKLRGMAMAEVGTTTYRPPYTPVAFGAMAGSEVRELFDPVRYTPMHQSHLARNAVMELVGQWHRPRYFPLAGENMDQAVHRECLAARQGVAMMDASTLGKIDIQGSDARELLNRLYTNSWSKLAPGKARYGIMCNENGMIIDDGVTTCLSDQHFLMTTTTGGAAHIYQWMETWLQTEWPELKVYLTSVTDHWATTAVVGPKARKLMRAICRNIDFTPEAFKFMEWRPGEIGGVPVRVMRISFSGELAYEINVQANYGRHIWEKVMQAGKRWNITPYGTESMHVLRAEKGYLIVGQDTDGSITPQDAGLSWAVASNKTYPTIGQRSWSRSDCLRKDRKQFVGLLPQDPNLAPPEGCQLTAAKDDTAMIGHITSSYLSPILGRSIALAVVKGGHDKMGKTIYAQPIKNGREIGESIPVTITSPVFYDKEGARTDGEL